MAVFKAYLKITKKNGWMILMYLAIFFSLTVMFQSFVGETEQGYSAQSVPVGVIDEDGGIMAQSLIDYIGRTNEVKHLSDDEEALQEDLFYRNVDYIVRIPEDFTKKCILGDENLKVTTVPGTYSGYYVEQQITNFMRFVRSYAGAGFTEQEMADAMSERDSAEITLVDISGNAGIAPAYSYFYRYLPYLFLSVLGYVMGYILMGVRRGSLPGRMRASAVPIRRQNMEGLTASGLIAAGLWGVCTGAVFFMYGADFLNSGRAHWYLLNSFVMLLMALSLAHLIGTLVKTSNALSGTVNVVSLGMCFLCGAFVQMDYLSPGVRKAAQFLPIYWYESVNEMLTEYSAIAGDVLTQALGGIGIQLVFAAAFVCVTLVVSRERRA